MLAEQIARNFANLARDAQLVLKEEGVHEIFIVVSNAPINREEAGICFFHWQEFLNRLWNQKVCSGPLLPA